MKLRELTRMLARAPKGAARWHAYADFREAARRAAPQDGVRVRGRRRRRRVDHCRQPDSHRQGGTGPELHGGCGRPRGVHHSVRPTGIAAVSAGPRRAGHAGTPRGRTGRGPSCRLSGHRVRGEHRLGIFPGGHLGSRPPLPTMVPGSICGRTPRWCGRWSIGPETPVTRPSC